MIRRSQSLSLEFKNSGSPCQNSGKSRPATPEVASGYIRFVTYVSELDKLVLVAEEGFEPPTQGL